MQLLPPAPVNESIPSVADAFPEETRLAQLVRNCAVHGASPQHYLPMAAGDAQAAVDTWLDMFGGVREWQQQQCHVAMTDGHVSTLLGRRLHMKTVQSGALESSHELEREAKLKSLQGSLADVIGAAVVSVGEGDIAEQLLDLNWRLVLQVRGELLLEGPAETAQEAKRLVNEAMTKPWPANNPLPLDLPVALKLGANWQDAK